jgi:hypothetical protein
LKKIISMILGILLLTMSFNTLGFADIKTDKANDKIAKIDVKILQMVDEAKAKGDNLLSEYNNSLIVHPDKADKLTDQFNDKLDKIINNLIEKTMARVQEIKNIAAKKGIEVISENITVIIGGRSVEIDPCRSISD